MPEACGGPTDPLHYFDDAWTKLRNAMNIEFVENPLKRTIEKYSFKETPGRPTEEPFEQWKDDALLKEYNKMNE